MKRELQVRQGEKATKGKELGGTSVGTECEGKRREGLSELE